MPDQSPDHSSDRTADTSLLRLLTVERAEDNFFTGIATPGGAGRSFGGQVIGQALVAATHTVDPSRLAHSLHAYFMRPGDAAAPVLYQVERDNDGRSFSTRRVIAIQNGRPILNMAASFHVSESGLSHQDAMPDVPGPEDLESDVQLAARYRDSLPERYLNHLKWDRPVEIRPVLLRPPFPTENFDPVQQMWFRVTGPVGDDPAMHRAALAFASDMGLLGVSMVPHRKSFSNPEMQAASLDHAMWIHRDFRADDWLLYAMDSPWAGGARGFNRGKVFTRDGALVANVAQEGLIRVITPKS
ncbi:MAG: acyl-CoA thioesterase-2 [Paracoccaceae bacterium]|jgi:acyl-CoA thioesterase-2